MNNKNLTIVLVVVALAIGAYFVMQSNSDDAALSPSRGLEPAASIGESYLLRADVHYDSGDDRHYVSIENELSGEEYSDRQEGDILNFGNVNLLIGKLLDPQEYVGFGTERAEFSTQNGDFNKIYDDLGNYLILPNGAIFPTSELIFEIFDRKDNLIERQIWGFPSFEDEPELKEREIFKDGAKHSFKLKENGSFIRLEVVIKDGFVSEKLVRAERSYAESEEGWLFAGYGQTSEFTTPKKEIAISSGRQLTYFDKKEGSNYHRFFFLSTR